MKQKNDFIDKGHANAVLAMIFLYNGCYQICAPVAPTYVMEMVPYSLRSKTAMLYTLMSNLGPVFNSFANPVAMEALSWRYYIIWCVVIAVNFVLIFFFFPETKGRGLEEVAEIFDGPDALPGVNAMRKYGFDVNVDEAPMFKKGRETGVIAQKLQVEQVEKT